MHAGVEQHGGVLAVAHAEGLGARETGQRDLARRRLPGARMRLLPTETAPIRAGIERRPVIVADAEGHKARAAVRRCHDRTSSLRPAYFACIGCARAPQTGGSSAAATRRSSASSTL